MQSSKRKTRKYSVHVSSLKQHRHVSIPITKKHNLCLNLTISNFQKNSYQINQTRKLWFYKSCLHKYRVIFHLRVFGLEFMKLSFKHIEDMFKGWYMYMFHDMFQYSTYLINVQL